MILEDISPGSQFGRWTVLHKSETKKHKETLYLCCCACGTMREVRRHALTSGKSKSCGCISTEKLIEKTTGKKSPRRKELIGERFGKLVVLEFEGVKDGRTTWKCRCDCGKVSTVLSSNLLANRVTSCGCVGNKNIEMCMLAQHEKELKENTNLSALTQATAKNNTTGRKGVHYNKNKRIYVAQITFQGKRYYLGSFRDFEKAVIAREEAEDKLFKPMLEKYGRMYE